MKSGNFNCRREGIIIVVAHDALRKKAKGPGGRPRYDFVMMFKLLILQSIYDLSDEKTQFMILDRLSFQRFLGLRISDPVPDEKTVWHFRNQLAEAGIIIELFGRFQARCPLVLRRIIWVNHI